jgi:hypothetical protein
VAVTRSAPGVAILFSVLLLGCDRPMASSNESLVPPVLLAEFETVAHTSAGLLMDSSDYKGLSVQIRNLLRFPYADLIGAFDSLGKQSLKTLIDEADAVLVGAKDFRPPDGLGSVRARLCYVIALRNPNRFDFLSAVDKSRLSPSDGSIWKWVTKPTESAREGQTFYATQLGRSYLILSNNLSDVRTVAKKLALAEAPSVPEFDNSAGISKKDFWVYRRYDASPRDDQNAAGLTDVTPSAHALSFSVESDSKSSVLRLIASDGGTAERLNATGKLPALRPVTLNTWQTTISLNDEKDVVEPMLTIMWLFGFGAYL